MKSLSTKNTTGTSIIEILMVVFIISLSLASLIGVSSFSLASSSLSKKTIQAVTLAEGAIEATRNFRDGTTWDTDGLGGVSLGVSYRLQKTTSNPPKWQLAQGEESVPGFSRKVVFSAVSRDNNDNIVSGGGVNDPNSKKVTATVSWQERGRHHQVSLISYLTNWR